LASRILTSLIIIYSLFFLRESYRSYSKFQKFYKKHFENVSAAVSPDRGANSILIEFAEFKLNPLKCPESFILIPETTSANQVMIRQVAEYSFTPCIVKIKETDGSPNVTSSDLILASQDKMQSGGLENMILQTSKNYGLFQIKP